MPFWYIQYNLLRLCLTIIEHWSKCNSAAKCWWYGQNRYSCQISVSVAGPKLNASAKMKGAAELLTMNILSKIYLLCVLKSKGSSYIPDFWMSSYLRMVFANARSVSAQYVVYCAVVVVIFLYGTFLGRPRSENLLLKPIEVTPSNFTK